MWCDNPFNKTERTTKRRGSGGWKKFEERDGR